MNIEVVESVLRIYERLFGLDLDDAFDDLLENLGDAMSECLSADEASDLPVEKWMALRKATLKELSQVPRIYNRIERVMQDFQRQVDEQVYEYTYYRSEEVMDQELLEMMFEAQVHWQNIPRKLVEANYQLVKKVAAKYHHNRRIDNELVFDDMVSAAQEALVAAAGRMYENPKKDFRSFAWKIMKEKVRDEQAAEHPIPPSVKGRIERLNHLRNEYGIEGYSNEDLAKLAGHMQCSAQEVRSLLEIEAVWGGGAVVDTEGVIEELEVADVSPDALTMLISHETCEQMYRALSELTKLQQELIEHVYFHEMTLREAADEMNLSLGVIKKHHQKAMRLLKDAFDPDTQKS